MQKINSSANIFIFADKTSNIYEMKPQNDQKYHQIVSQSL